jgi:hypothetical protein
VSLGSWIADRALRSKVSAAREGKMGQEVRGVINVADGWKRIIVLGILLANFTVGYFTGTDYLPLIERGLGVLGWHASDALLNISAIAAIGASIGALIDGIVKETRRRRLEAASVTIAKLPAPGPSIR